MKKFLFTLATLLMAGTAFAANYAYIDDVELTPDQLGKEVILQVKVHADVAFNAYTFNFTFDGDMTHKAYAEPDEDHGAFEVPYYNAQGKARTAMVVDNCMGDVDKGLIGFIATSGFWQDPNGEDPNAWVTYGVVKWMPQEEDYQFYYISITPSENFTGGTITLDGNFSAGADARDIPVAYPDIVYFNNQVCHITVKQTAQPAPKPTITMDENYQVSAVVYDEEGNVVERDVKLYTVELDEEGNEVEGTRQEVTNPYNVTQTYQEQKISFVAVTPKADGESEDTECEPKTFTIPAKDKEEVDAPTVEGKANDNAWQYNIVITPDGDGDGELKFTVTDAEGNTVPNTSYQTNVDEETGVVTLVFDKGDEAVTVHVEAYTAEGETCAESVTTKEDIEIPALDQVKTPVITYIVNDDNTITITATCETEGATIVLKDPEGNVVDNPATVEYDPYAGYSKTWTATATKEHMQDSETGSKLVTVDAMNKKEAAKPTIEGKKREGSKKLFDIIITPDANTDGQLVVTADPEAPGAKAAAQTLTYERKAEDYEVDVTAQTLEGPTYLASPLAEETILVPKLDQVAEPEINYTVNGDQLTVTATCETEGATVVLVGPDGTEYPNGTATVTFDPYEDYSKTWTATASAEDMLDNSAEKKIEIAKKKVYEVADPTISVDNSDPTKTVITIEATEGNLTYNIDAEEGVVYTVEEVDGKVIITVVNGDETAFVTVTATTTLTEVPAGYDEVKNGEAKEIVEIPAKPEQTEEPTINVSFGEAGDNTVAYVTFKNNDEKPATIWYSTDGGDTWNKYDPAVPVTFTATDENQEITVLAYAQAEGKLPSDEVDRTFELNNTATSVNELTNGKTVAGVRYFNMAGQEMQEANGITIVVTTYTDGTTSAVKVMK